MMSLGAIEEVTLHKLFIEKHNILSILSKAKYSLVQLLENSSSAVDAVIITLMAASQQT